MLDCVGSAPVVLVAPTFEVKPDSMQVPQWNDFVRRGEAMLASGFDCTQHDGFRLCMRTEIRPEP